MKTHKLFLVVLASIFFIGCERDHEPIITDDVIDNIANQNDDQPSASIEQRAIQPVILGKQKENPYSVQNMQIALDSLRAYANAVGDDELHSNAGIHTKSLNALTIGATDLYVRFLPQDSAGYDMLTQDSTLELFSYPLDYEIVQAGDYYLDPSLPDSTYTWLYAVVKPGYQPPQGVAYEVLSNLFLIENSEGYTEEVITETEESAQTKSTGSSPKGVIDNNLRRALVATSFVLTGNGGELRKDESSAPGNPLMKRQVTTCKRSCILWGRVCWTSCNTRYYPEGYIRVNTPSGNVGLKGVKVRTSRWFYYITMRTDASGYYSSSSSYYDDILIGNSANYDIFFDGANGSNSWTFSKTLFGALCFWTSSYGAGSHSPNGHSMTFYTNSDYWGRAVLHNAIYDYITYARADGISLPPNSLDIASKESDKLTSSAPLLNHHFDYSYFTASMIATICAGPLGVWLSVFGWLASPDLILRYNKTLNSYNEITAIAWHELTHASQLQRMKSENGKSWASGYWSTIVYQEAKNELTKETPYASKGGDDWQAIALAEGWANYRQWDLARRYLRWNTLTYRDWSVSTTTPEIHYSITNANHFPYYFAGMFNRLRQIGCSSANIEKSLCAYSVTGFRDNLIAKHPNLRTQINTIVSEYE
ncbi:MAG: hypothetical protein LBB79_06575 [Prevotellaceae bacterium]|jgi:hypothetical protein|nr:hypothetical protein [Prevotellaceae bacterium]